MLSTFALLALAALADAPGRKEPPAQQELAAITERGRNLAAYDVAVWHASDAVQALGPKEGSVERYIARHTEKGWEVAFGRLNEKRDTFLVAYKAVQGKKPESFSAKELAPPAPDKGFYLFAARAIDTVLKEFMAHFEGERRPYNVAVLPAEKGQFWVYLVPAQTAADTRPLGGDVRYLISANGLKIVAQRRMHKTIIENPPPRGPDDQQVAGMHTHVLDDAPEDSDVFHVLARKPSVPELVITNQFIFQVNPDGSIKYAGKSSELQKKE